MLRSLRRSPIQGGARDAILRAPRRSPVRLQQGQALCKEVEILRRLHHPNIVKLMAAFVDVDSSFLYPLFPYGHGDLGRVSAAAPPMPASPLTSFAACPASWARPSRTWQSATLCTAISSPLTCLWTVRTMVAALAPLWRSSPTLTLATLTMALQTRGLRGLATHWIHRTRGGVGAPGPAAARRLAPQASVFGLACVIYHMHMYPRAPAEPHSAEDDVASSPGLFDMRAARSQRGPPRLPATPLHVQRAPIQPPSYLRVSRQSICNAPVASMLAWLCSIRSTSWLVPESPEVEAQVEQLFNATAKPKEHGRGRDSHKGRLTPRGKLACLVRVLLASPRIGRRASCGGLTIARAIIHSHFPVAFGGRQAGKHSRRGFHLPRLEQTKVNRHVVRL